MSEYERMKEKALRICYVANSRFPSERAHMTQIVQMCNAFAENGVQVTLLVTDRKTHITDTPEAFFGTPLHFTVVRVKVPDIAGASPRIPRIFRPFLFSIQRLVFAYRAFRHIHNEPYTHVYGRDEWILWFLSALVHVPIVWESHEARFTFPAKRIMSRIQKCVVISEGIKDLYLEHGIPDHKIVVAHDAVDQRFFEPHIAKEDARKQLKIQSTRPVVMYIGGFEDWKNPQILFAASRNQSAYEVYVVGGKVHEIERYRNTYPHVHFLGARPYKELPQHQQAADVLVVTNTGRDKLASHYTSPLKLFAHMTSLKPIVAPNIPSIQNVLRSDEAFFFQADDPTSLNETIIRVLQNPEVAAQVAKNALKKSRACTWYTRAQSIIPQIL